MVGQNHIRHGVGTARPYVYGYLDLADFIKQAFGAEEIERVEQAPNEFHVEARIGDSVVVLELGATVFPGATKASVYVYVDDVDAAYRRAIQAGGSSLAPPEDKPYQERGAGVKDSFGNTWWIAAYIG